MPCLSIIICDTWDILEYLVSTRSGRGVTILSAIHWLASPLGLDHYQVAWDTQELIGQ